MFSYAEIETKLAKSNWPEDAKKALLSVCPRLGRWSLSFLNQQLSTVGSEYDAELISTIISRQPNWYELILNNQQEQVEQEVNHIIQLENEISDKALLAVILDIRNNKSVALHISSKLSDIFDPLEVKYIRYIPYKEVASMLNSRITSFIKLADILMHIKLYCYYQGLINSDDVEVLAFRKALENNEQVIGGGSNTIAIWLKDFVENQIGTVDHSAYNVARYLTTSQLAKKLSAQDKNVISEIAKLYNWLFQPYVTEEEIEHYEKQLAGKNQPVEKITQPEPVLPKQPTPPKTPVLSEPQHYARPKPVVPVRPSPLSDNAIIHDLINKKRKDKLGVVKDATNIIIQEETDRIEQDLINQDKQIQKKLDELKVRNKTE